MLIGEVEPELADELARVRALSPAHIQDEAMHAFHPGREPEPRVLRPKTAGELKGRRSFSRWNHYGMRFRMVGNTLEKDDDLDEETEDQIRSCPPRKALEASSPKKEFKRAKGFLLFDVEPKAEYLKPAQILSASEGKRGSSLTHLSGGMNEDHGDDGQEWEEEDQYAFQEEEYMHDGESAPAIDNSGGDEPGYGVGYG